MRQRSVNGDAPSEYATRIGQGSAQATADARLDRLTGGMLKNPSQISTWTVDTAMNKIQGLRSPNERILMAATLIVRLQKYGATRGWTGTYPMDESGDKRAFSYARYFAQLLGFSGDSVDKKISDELIDRLFDYFKKGLKSADAEAAEFWKGFIEFIKADSVEERFAILSKYGGTDLAKWIGDNYKVWAKSSLKAFEISKRTQSKILEILSDAAEGAGRLAEFLGRWNPILFALDLLLTPTEIAPDPDMEELNYYSAYQEAIKRASQFGSAGAMQPSPNSPLRLP